jgi:hypothetical protein
MGLLERVMCRLGKHYRSRGYARKDELGWRSRCVYCGTPMRRLPDGQWVADTGALIDEEDGALIQPATSERMREQEATPAPPAPRRKGLFRRKAQD